MDRRRRPWGDGTVTRDGAGWVALLFIDGKRRKRRARTEAQAYKRLSDLRRERDRGLGGMAPRYTVGQLLDDYLRDCEARLEPSTLTGYRRTADAYIRPDLERVRVRKLSPRRAQAWINELVDRGLAPKTIANARGLLRAAINGAVRRLELPHNVAELVELPTMRRREAPAFSPEQALRFLRALDGDRLEALYAVAVALGLRRSEIVGLRWEDVDLERGILHVRRKGYHLAGGAFYVGEPKSERSRRSIPLPAVLVDALRAHWKRQREEEGECPFPWEHPELVFTTQRGAPLRGEYVRRQLARIIAGANARLAGELKRALLPGERLPDLTLHQLRHSAASLMHAMGANMREIQEVLGHASYAFTADTYSHLAIETRRPLADKLDLYLRGGPLAGGDPKSDPRGEAEAP